MYTCDICGHHFHDLAYGAWGADDDADELIEEGLLHCPNCKSVAISVEEDEYDDYDSSFISDDEDYV